MHAILIHGMGRSPASMLPLAMRLRAHGMASSLFAYSAAVEGFEACVDRLRRHIDMHIGVEPFVIVGHSLGTVLARAAIPRLRRAPEACLLLAPPTTACRAARHFSKFRLYRLLTGEMGQLLADARFMTALPFPTVPTTIYAGIGGPRGRFSPFGGAANDGILALAETMLPAVPLRKLPALHTFIMNAEVVALDIEHLAFSA